MENKEYIEREKAIAYVEEQYRLFKEEEDKLAIVRGCVSSVEGVPVDKDVIRVVRCNNCRYFRPYFNSGKGSCDNEDITELELEVNENDFCSHAAPLPCSKCKNGLHSFDREYICRKNASVFEKYHSCLFAERKG